MKLGFKSAHPFSAFLFFVFSFVLSMSASHPIILAISFFTGLIYDLKLNGKKAIGFFLKVIIPMIILLTAFNALFSHYGVTVLFTMRNGNSFTLEPLVFGFVFSLRASSALFWLNCFNEIITSDKFIFLFGRFSPKLALIVSMVLRFIPLIRSQSEEIKRAEKGSGNFPSETDFISRLRQSARRLSILISWTLEKGIDTSDSMRARGYGLSGRSSYNSYRFSAKDILVLAFSAVSLVFVFLVNGKLKASFNPMIDISSPDLFSSLAALFFTVTLLIPPIYDLKEERKWSILKLKI